MARHMIPLDKMKKIHIRPCKMVGPDIFAEGWGAFEYLDFLPNPDFYPVAWCETLEELYQELEDNTKMEEIAKKVVFGNTLH